MNREQLIIKELTREIRQAKLTASSLKNLLPWSEPFLSARDVPQDWQEMYLRRALKNAQRQKLTLNILKYAALGIVISYWGNRLFSTIGKISSSQPVIEQQQAAPENQQEWYNGGTLHDKTVADWEKATEEDKLATCADWISFAWQNEKLSEDLTDNLNQVGMDGVKILAEQLRESLDQVLSANEDGTFDSQSIAEFATVQMTLSGWYR